MTGLGRRIAVGVAFGLLVGVALMIYSDVSALMAVLGAFDWMVMLPVIGASLFGYAIRVAKWEVYLRRLDIRIPLGESTLLFVAGMVMSITPGKVGEVLKSFLLRQARGVPVARSAPIVVAERLTDLMALLTLATFGVAASGYGWPVLVVGIALVLALLLVFSVPSVGRLAVRACAVIPVLGRIAPKLEEARESMTRLMGPVTLTGTLLLSLFAWSCEAIGTWWLLGAFPGVQATLGEATFAYSFATVAGALSMLPGGLLATEGSMIALLHGLLEVTPSPEVATAVTLLVRFATLWLGVGLGGIALVAFQRRYLAGGPAQYTAQ